MESTDIRRLIELSNDNILFEASGESLLIRSIPFRYADFIKIKDIEKITIESKHKARISMKNPTAMGDMTIEADLFSGIVTADGRKFDEAMQDFVQKKATTKRKGFKPSINGFSIKDVQTMPSEDGYACSCKILFNGTVVGDFLDKGDGSEYQFWANPPYSSSKIDAKIRSFPPITRDYGIGPMTIEYDMNQMVNELMEMSEIAKEIGKLKDWQDYVLIDDWVHNNHYSMKPAKTMTDEEVNAIVDKQLNVKGSLTLCIRRFKDESELTVTNTFTTDSNLK